MQVALRFDLVAVIKMISSLFNVIGFEVSILGHKYSVNSTRAGWPNSLSSLWAQHTLSQ
jgi:hypothetical protein